MLTPDSVLKFFALLDNFDSVTIEENQLGENVTLQAIKAVNSGNNCLHYCIILNNHRIVIQTYKDMNIPNRDVDVVQGKVELEEDFIDFIDFLNDNRQSYQDSILNLLFVTYCGLWQKCSHFYLAEMDNYICEFGPFISCIFSVGDNDWYIDMQGAVTLDQLQIVLDFIQAIKNICK